MVVLTLHDVKDTLFLLHKPKWLHSAHWHRQGTRTWVEPNPPPLHWVVSQVTASPISSVNCTLACKAEENININQSTGSFKLEQKIGSKWCMIQTTRAYSEIMNVIFRLTKQKCVLNKVCLLQWHWSDKSHVGFKMQSNIPWASTLLLCLLSRR